MKIRVGFVSNSSSSSFAIALRKLSLEQVCKILNHQVWGEKLGVDYAKTDPWHIIVENGVLYADTDMDNFDMEEFLEKIGVQGTVWDINGGEFPDQDPTDIDDCDTDCDSCIMRFLCYTNQWSGVRDTEV